MRTHPQKGPQAVKDAVAAGEEFVLAEGMAARLNDVTLLAAQTRAYLLGYFAAFAKDEARSHLVEVEVFDEGDGETGFVDSLMNIDGELWIVEDKTTGRFVDADQMELALRLDDQIGTYVLAMQDKGHNIAGVKYRQVLKTMTRVNKNETLEEYKKRVANIYLTETKDKVREFTIQLHQRELDLFRRQKERQNLEILSHLDVYDLDQWPANPSNCIGPYGPCDYLGICIKRCDNSQRTFKPRKTTPPQDSGNFQKQIWSAQ